MQLIRGIGSLCKQYPNPVVTIGVFDGVHRAHQRIIQKVIKTAEIRNGTSFLVTFHPHPLKVLSCKNAPSLLISLEHRLAILSRMGIDVVLLMRFDKYLARFSAEDFVGSILVDKIGAHCVIIGEDFLFGKDRQGDVKLLKTLGLRFGFAVEVVPQLKLDDKTVSSTLIRRVIERGELEFASKLLGRRVSIFGTVVQGKSLGRIIGYPTANIDHHHEIIPPNGVYAVKARLNDKWFGGILNIGQRPTFGSQHEPSVEVHLIDFNRDIYGKTIEVVLFKKIRDEKKFPSRESLIAQIEQDEQIARSLHLANQIP